MGLAECATPASPYCSYNSLSTLYVIRINHHGLSFNCTTNSRSRVEMDDVEERSKVEFS